MKNYSYIGWEMRQYLSELTPEKAGETINLILKHDTHADKPINEIPIERVEIDDIITGATSLYCVDYEGVCVEFGFYSDRRQCYIAINLYVNGLVTVAMWKAEPEAEPEQDTDPQPQEAEEGGEKDGK